MSKQGTFDLAEYGLSSVNHDINPHDTDAGDYKHEIIFEEKIDILTLMELAHKSGFNIELEAIRKDTIEPIYLTSGIRGHKKDARVYINSMKYNDGFKLYGPKAKQLIVDYGTKKLKWNPEDVTLKVILGGA